MGAYLCLGFLVGMGHALEADHLAAMAVLKRGRGWSIIWRGAAWGAGHTLMLFFICSIAVLFSLSISARFSAALEGAVGIMLILLGLDVLRRMRKRSLHLHVHKHGGSLRHLHVHKHEHGEASHRHDEHDHDHPSGFPVRALLLGLVHGAAGSAGLLALTVAATQNAGLALLYIALFGCGSLFGMMLLSAVVFWPVALMERQLGWLYRGLRGLTAIFAVGLGVLVIYGSFPGISGF